MLRKPALVLVALLALVWLVLWMAGSGFFCMGMLPLVDCQSGALNYKQ